jgi:Fe-S oxidoreductase
VTDSSRSDFEPPPLSGSRRIPVVTPGASAHQQPYRADAAQQGALGFPGERVDGWQQVAVRKIGELVSSQRSLQVFLDACVKCGACTDKCHYYLGTGDPKNMPVARQDLFRSVYRRYYTFAGRHLPWLVGARDFDEDMLQDWYTYFNQCSQCRRCSVYCPVGIDTAEFSMAAREVMHSIGVGQKYTNQVIARVHKLGNNLGLPQPALADTLAGLEEDVEEETGVPVRFPLDQRGAEVLLVTPSADFFAEPHVDGLIGYAKVLHQAGISWTLSSHASEAANFGLFIGSHDTMRSMALRIREAALDLGVRRIVFGECGHAWRVAYSFMDTLAGPFDFLDPRYPVPQHIVEVTHDLMSRGALTLDATVNDERVVTFHDSCNVARASRMGDRAGGQLTLPREVLRAVCNHVVEMSRGSVGEATFCCGGGGGLLTDELMELRVKGALPRMQAFHAVSEARQVTHMVAICAICKSQFSRILPHYGYQMDQVLSLHQLVGDALVLRRTG